MIQLDEAFRWVESGPESMSRRFGSSARRCWMPALLAGACACSSSGGDAQGPSRVEGGTGAEPAASAAPATAVGEGGGEGSASALEAQDPGSLPNVTPPRESGRAPAQPSTGCGELAPVGSGEQTLDVAGTLRTYLLDLPAGYDGVRPYPLVFAFHGATTSGASFRSARYGNLLSTVAGDAIVVHPDALGEPTAWNDRADLPFFDAMLAALDATLCVDDVRVFATGHSSGGFLTNALGCQRGDVLRAVAPVSAGGPFPARGGGCTGEVAVWLAHAENDQTVAFENGVLSRDRWRETNGCADTATASEPSPCVEYAGCRRRAPRTLVRVCRRPRLAGLCARGDLELLQRPVT